jgi:hypothetical protein
MADGDTIIIRGGSVEVEFDTGSFSEQILPDPNPKKRKKHKNANKITQVVVKIDNVVKFDSGDVPSGLTCEITASYK